MIGTSKPFVGYGRLRGLRILVAEDSWLIADTLSVLLEEEGAHVIGPSPTSAGALELLAREEADFALVDMMLGDAFADRLVDELVGRGIPYAIVTGYGALPSNADAHAVKVVRKPIDKKVLVEMLSAYVARSH